MMTDREAIIELASALHGFSSIILVTAGSIYSLRRIKYEKDCRTTLVETLQEVQDLLKVDIRSTP